jgi:ribonuclease G
LKTEILISCDDWENRVAVLEDGALAEIYFEREEKVIGSIYKGRVENVLPGMGACFVNIGLATPLTSVKRKLPTGAAGTQ